MRRKGEQREAEPKLAETPNYRESQGAEKEVVAKRITTPLPGGTENLTEKKQ